MSSSIFSRPEIVWFLLGLILFLLELITPGFFIFFFAIGAWITALICLIGEPSTNVQILIFAVTSVLSLMALRRIIQKKFFASKELNDESDAVEDEFTGKEALAINDFEPGKTGKVDFKGTTWKAESELPIHEGQRVIIKFKENFKLIVEPIK